MVTGVNWSGAYFPFIGSGDSFVPAAEDDFQIRIYDDAGGVPGSLAATFNVGNAVNRTAGSIQTLGGLTVQTFDYSAPINFSFNAGTTQWISFLNNTALDVDNFGQSVVALGGNAFGDLNPNDGVFATQGFTTDFQLTTSVPEPSSIAFLGLGLAGLFVRRKR